MTWYSMLMLAVGLSMDTFAVSLALGANAKQMRATPMLGTGLLFAAAASLMAIAGWLGALAFAGDALLEHQWLGGLAVAGIGIHMIAAADSSPAEGEAPSGNKSPALAAVALAIATSLDSAAAGAALALHQAPIVTIAGVIAAVTALVCMLGTMLGFRFKMGMGQLAEVVGGTVLVGIGGWGFWF